MAKRKKRQTSETEYKLESVDIKATFTGNGNGKTVIAVPTQVLAPSTRYAKYGLLSEKQADGQDKYYSSASATYILFPDATPPEAKDTPKKKKDRNGEVTTSKMPTADLINQLVQAKVDKAMQELAASYKDA